MTKITVENNVYSYLSADKSVMQEVYDALSFQEINHKTKRKYRVSFINKKTGEFKTGLINTIKKIINQDDIKIIDKTGNEQKKYQLKDLPGFTYRQDQSFLIKKMLHRKRGVLVSLMGTGKTLMMNALINSLEDKKILCICGAKDVHEKNFKRSKEFFSDDVYLVQSKKDTEWKNYRIVFGSSQIMAGIDPNKFVTHFDVILFDEGHHMTEGIEKILDSCNAEYRFAFTGTFPSDKKKQFNLIGLFGDVINGEKEKKLVEKKILSKIKVTFYSPEPIFHELRRYQDIYELCVVNNKQRNELIVKNSIERMNQGLSGLIMTTRIEHGNNLRKVFKKHGYDIPFIHGGTPIDERKKYEKLIENKDILCIITNVWREGVDLPSLNYVNLALGEKAEDRLLQIAGRTSRWHESKDWGEIVDYLDIESARYLSGHTVQRLRAYSLKGWI